MVSGPSTPSHTIAFSPALNSSPDNTDFSVDQPCQGVDNSACEQVSPWPKRDRCPWVAVRGCTDNADCPVNFHCHNGNCIRSPRDDAELDAHDTTENTLCKTSVDCAVGSWCRRGRCDRIPRLPSKLLTRDPNAGETPNGLETHQRPCNFQRRCWPPQICLGGWCRDPFKVMAREDAGSDEAFKDCKIHQECYLRGRCINGKCSQT
ncbi:uncharacterized protein BDW43DRAFT_314961 [Aspergillus alliaceus]|uniref:uncharacterized protein n=1 Tax=Petromyces alliaceus TaxID=209559 RepID=UPI0012A4240E|nr:uncharacterized protein BDW43DRAFT_314961 [Aspergillus alliaceus]KAB8229383.1 hypothetical protein BDW43DRAFT_314961 [Aspergillus alliaceus]